MKDIEELVKAQTDDKKKVEHDLGKCQSDKQTYKSENLSLIKEK